MNIIAGFRSCDTFLLLNVCKLKVFFLFFIDKETVLNYNILVKKGAMNIYSVNCIETQKGKQYGKNVGRSHRRRRQSAGG